MNKNEATTTRIHRLNRRIQNLRWATRALGQDRTAEIADLVAEVERIKA